jgi:hypothetical protein
MKAGKAATCMAKRPPHTLVKGEGRVEGGGGGGRGKS